MILSKRSFKDYTKSGHYRRRGKKDETKRDMDNNWTWFM